MRETCKGPGIRGVMEDVGYGKVSIDGLVLKAFV